MPSLTPTEGVENTRGNESPLAALRSSSPQKIIPLSPCGEGTASRQSARQRARQKQKVIHSEAQERGGILNVALKENKNVRDQMQPDQSGSQQNVSSTLSSKNSPGSEISVSPNKSKLKPKQSGKPKSKAKANNGDTKSKKAPEKRKKSVLPSRCVLILKTWMMSPEHIHHPYPTEEQKLELCHRTGIGLKQLTNWFTNNRKRLWRPHMRQLIAQREEAGLSALPEHASLTLGQHKPGSKAAIRAAKQLKTKLGMDTAADFAAAAALATGMRGPKKKKKAEGLSCLDGMPLSRSTSYNAYDTQKIDRGERLFGGAIIVPMPKMGPLDPRSVEAADTLAKMSPHVVPMSAGGSIPLLSSHLPPSSSVSSTLGGGGYSIGARYLMTRTVSISSLDGVDSDTSDAAITLAALVGSPRIGPQGIGPDDGRRGRPRSNTWPLNSAPGGENLSASKEGKDEIQSGAPNHIGHLSQNAASVSFGRQGPLNMNSLSSFETKEEWVDIYILSPEYRDVLMGAKCDEKFSGKLKRGTGAGVFGSSCVGNSMNPPTNSKTIDHSALSAFDLLLKTDEKAVGIYDTQDNGQEEFKMNRSDPVNGNILNVVSKVKLRPPRLIDVTTKTPPMWAVARGFVLNKCINQKITYSYPRAHKNDRRVVRGRRGEEITRLKEHFLNRYLIQMGCPTIPKRPKLHNSKVKGKRKLGGRRDSNKSKTRDEMLMLNTDLAKYDSNIDLKRQRTGDSHHRDSSVSTGKRNLPKQSTKLLKDWLLSPEHIHHPYPTDEEKELLMEDTGIGMKQLTNWFTNARKRIWQPMFTSSSSASVTATATAAAAAASLGIIDIDIARVQRGAKAALSARNAKKGGRAAHDASAVSGGMHTLSGSPRSQARCRKKGNGRTLANASEVAVKPASRNDFMLYVQCLSCKKWRKLPIGTFDVSDVPRKWTCSMAHNGGFSSKEAQKKANQEFNEQQELRDKTGLGHWLSPSCRILQQKLLPGRAPPWPSLDSEGGCLPVKLQPPVVRVSVKHEVKKKEMNAMRDYVRNDTEAKDARATTALAGFGEPIEWTPGHVDDIDNAWATNIDVAAVAIPATQITDPNGVLVINPVNNISDIKLCVDVSNSIKNQNTNIVNDDDTDRQSMDIDEKGTSSQAEVPT